EKLFDIREKGGMMRPEARTGQACGLGGNAAAGDGDRLSLTREELIELLLQSSQLLGSLRS
ncbi:MAG: hypothetical protein ACK5RS_06795, partial [Acidobacteriota bacterium]